MCSAVSDGKLTVVHAGAKWRSFRPVNQRAPIRFPRQGMSSQLCGVDLRHTYLPGALRIMG
jgi:hypothetical protein